MVTLLVLFPLMLVQLGANVLVLRSADSSALVAAKPLQIVVLLVTVALLACGLWFVLAGLRPFVRASQSGEELTADDALREFRGNLGPVRAGGTPGGFPWRAAAPLLAGVLVVVALTVWATGNEQTVGTAFLTMCALFAVSTLTMPVPAVMILLAQAGFVPPEPEPEASPEPAAQVVPAGPEGSRPPPSASSPAPAPPATSVPPPGAAPAPPEDTAEAPAPVADPGADGADEPPAGPARPSVPPPGV